MPPVAKNKRCKPFCVLTAEGRRQTGSKWLKIYWNALFKKPPLRQCSGAMQPAYKKTQNQPGNEKKHYKNSTKIYKSASSYSNTNA